MAIATFAAGCFWGVEQSFRQLTGVLSTRVGYCNGSMEAPNYTSVCTGRTGHAEAIEITFNSDLISYENLLNHFWQLHNPTTLNRQGPDIGHQYRSTIFYLTKEQRQTAERMAATVKRATTEIVPAKRFYLAEDYHQNYLGKD